MGFYQRLLGKRFGRLKVTREEDWPGWVLCVCDCGKYRAVMVVRLLRGEIVECVACDVRRKMESFSVVWETRPAPPEAPQS